MVLSLGSMTLDEYSDNYVLTHSTSHVEYLESSYQHFLRTNKDLPSLVKAIHVYTKDWKKAQRYAELILVSAKNKNLDPWLVFAVISKESSFDNNAKSYVGAKGLMQVMPFWKDEIGEPNDDLYDPQISIQYGTKILRLYLDQYKSTNAALAAYNGTKGSMKYPLAVFKKMKHGKKSASINTI